MTRLPSFADFFAALWERGDGGRVSPFPWQVRLAEAAVAGSWPRAIAVPTGCGKTSVIEIWAWALAAGASGSGARQPRRLFFVIDRRVVVDDVFARAETIAERLASATQGPLAPVAEALSTLGGRSALRAVRLRGGLELDPGWAEDPAQPLVCATTVDQVGSRLLFRGYGLSHGTKNPLAIHAALVGEDALIVLDEAHLSAPFDDTLAAAERHRRRGEVDLGLPWLAVRMTATPLHADGALSLGDDDRMDPRLRRRLQAPKPARLHPAAKRGQTDRVAEACIAQLAAWLGDDGGPGAIGCVVNRVARARAIASTLRALHPEVDVVCLVGPARPVERDALLSRIWPRVRAGRTRDAIGRPIVVVATQTIEVGADLDFDALVTECASSDALRQRFGRLDRLGELDGLARAAVVESPSGGPDPVYGEALERTWDWLRSLECDDVVDLGISAAPLPPDDTRSPVSGPPSLLPAYLDRWVQTSPIPEPDPSVPVFLHGADASGADVEIVWRADLDPASPEGWADVVSLMPPSGREAVRVPVRTARRWLAELVAADVADVEGGAALEGASVEDTDSRGHRPALRWRGANDDETGLVSAAGGGEGARRPPPLRPGDTIVVPAAYGGCDEDGWAPDSRQPVVDLAELAAPAAARTVLRLHPNVLAQHGLDPGLTTALLVLDEDDPGQLVPDQAAISAAVRHVRQSPSRLTEVAECLATGDWTATAYPTGKGVAIALRDAAPSDEDTRLGGAAREILLADHQERVARCAVEWGRLLGLDEAVIGALEAAGRAHDEGKRDPRFQTLLLGGVSSLGGPPVAKSRAGRRARQSIRSAWRAAGLPVGYRHEATSLAVLGEHAAGRDGCADLVAHLVASHHGCARPLLPPVADPSPWRDTSELARVDGEVAERFWRLTRRYGWWGLAHLEAVLRLADHRVSGEESG